MKNTILFLTLGLIIGCVNHSLPKNEETIDNELEKVTEYINEDERIEPENYQSTDDLDILIKDIDFDGIIDSTYIDLHTQTIVCQLSSKDFERIESLPIELMPSSSRVSDAKNGFSFDNHWMRAGYSSQFRYNRESAEIELIGMSRYEFGNAANDGSGESSVNLLTDDLVADWNYYDFANEELVAVPTIKTELYLQDVSLDEFSEEVYFNYAEQDADLFHRFKEIEKNTRAHREKIKAEPTWDYSEFFPKSIDQPELIKLSSDSSFYSINSIFQINSYKIASSYFNPKTSDADWDNWGDALLCLNSENQILYQSKGVGDVYLYEPHFYRSEKSHQIIILCQLAFEYYFGAEAFLFENGNIESLGFLDVEGYDHETSLVDIVEIKENEHSIQFSFQADTLILEPGSEDILIENSNTKYVYSDSLFLIRE